MISDKVVNRILTRAIEILKTCGWCRVESRKAKFPWIRRGDASDYQYCVLGAIALATSEHFKIPFEDVQPYGNGEAAALVYAWNDGLMPFSQFRGEEILLGNGKVPPRILRGLRKAMLA